MLPRPAFYFLVAAVCVPHLATAQVVHGVIQSAADNQPVPYGTVRAIAGADTIDRFTNRSGEFTLGDLANGTYRLRARMLGYAPLDTMVDGHGRRRWRPRCQGATAVNAFVNRNRFVGS